MSGKRNKGQPLQPQPQLEDQEEEMLRVIVIDADQDAEQENFSASASAVSAPPQERTGEMLTALLDCEQESLTVEQQEDLVDWFAEHPIFYDQSTSDFKNRSKRDRLLDAKGYELGVSGTFIWHWFRNLRTVYGKLKKKQSGQPAKPLTARKIWTMQRFQFLDQHLCIRSARRHMGLAATTASDQSVMTALPPPPMDVQEGVEAVDVDEDDDNEEVTPTSIGVPFSSTSTVTHASTPTCTVKSGVRLTKSSSGRKGKPKGVDDAILKICAQMAGHGKVQSQQDSQLNNPMDSRVTYCSYLGSEVGELNESQWCVFQQTTLELIVRFRRERQQQKAQQQQQQKAQQPPQQQQPQPRQQQQPYLKLKYRLS